MPSAPLPCVRAAALAGLMLSLALPPAAATVIPIDDGAQIPRPGRTARPEVLGDADPVN